MSNFSDIGNLMHLHRYKIQPGEGTSASAFLITATAKALNRFGGRNWVPVIVKEIGEDQYEVIGNSFIYAVAEEADLERVWCIIADSSKETLELTKILSGEETPKINLSTATRDEIQAGLKYLKDKNLVKDFDLLVATNRIDEAPARPYWKTLEPITSLKCKITKAKIKSLEEVFYLDPQPEPQVEPEPKVEPESKSLKDLTVKKLKEIAKQRKIAGYNNMKKPELIKALSQNSP